jgi:hypothetical protein
VAFYASIMAFIPEATNNFWPSFALAEMDYIHPLENLKLAFARLYFRNKCCFSQKALPKPLQINESRQEENFKKSNTRFRVFVFQKAKK